VALARTDVSEERITSSYFLLATAKVVISPIVSLMIEELCSYETSVLTRATRR
jgi:hypothetical protein